MRNLRFQIALSAALGLAAALAGCGGEDVANCAALTKSAPDKAMEHCNRAVASRLVWSKDKANVRVNRGTLLAGRREWAAAIDDLTRGLNSGRLEQAARVVALFHRGSARIQSGQVAEGIADLDETLELDPVYTDAYANRALARRLQGDHARAIEDAGAALKLNPRHVNALVQRGATYLLKGDGDRALADLNEAVRLEPGSPGARNIRGVLLRARGDWDRALSDFDEAVRLDPRDAGTLRNRASALAAKRDFERALADLDASLKLDPGSAEALLRRAAIRAERGDLDRAFADAGRVIELNPRVADAWNLRGWVRTQRKEFDAAIGDFNQALALNQRHLPALTNRMSIWSAKKEHARTVADLEAIAQLAPATADYRGIGLLRYYLGRYAESAEALTQALRAKPDDHYAALWRYFAQARAGNEPEARKAFVQAAQSLPGGKWPAAVVGLFLGKTSESAMLAAANDPDPKTRAAQLCEAGFYAAQAKLLRNQVEQALPQLRAAAQDCPRDFAEHDGAVAGLKRLGK